MNLENESVKEKKNSELNRIFYGGKFEFIFILFSLRLYLFISRQRGREGEKGREPSMCGCLSHIPYWGPGRQPRQVPWLGIELATLCFAGRHSIHWATPARAEFIFRKNKKSTYIKYCRIWNTLVHIIAGHDSK